MENGIGIKMTVVEDGKMVEFILGVVEKDNEWKPGTTEQLLAWIEQGGEGRYMENPIYSGGDTGAGIKLSCYKKRTIQDQGIRLVTNDPMLALQWIEDKEAAEKAEAKKRAAGLYKAAERINQMPERFILADHSYGALTLIRSTAIYNPHRSSSLGLYFRLVLVTTSADGRQYEISLNEELRTKAGSIRHEYMKKEGLDKKLFGQEMPSRRVREFCLAELEKKIKDIKAQAQKIRQEEAPM